MEKKHTGQLEGTKQLGRTRRKGGNSIKADIKAVGCEGVGWIYLAYNREHGNDLSGLLKRGNFVD
jgi:hypothetical protein